MIPDLEGAPYISQFKRRHGLLWSPELQDPFIDLILWQRYREAPYCYATIPNNLPHELCMSACRGLFSPKQLALHRWAERMIKSYTEETGMQIWLGAGSSGKSHIGGLCVLLDYITSFAAAADGIAAGEIVGSMYGMLVSTSKEALAKRSLASAVEYLGYLRTGAFGVSFKFLSQKFAILPETVGEENIASFKARIDGVALAEGSETEAKGKIIGVHLPRVRVIGDEFENLSAVRAAAFLSAQTNLRAGCADYKCLLLSNPQNRLLPCSSLAEPVSGWENLDLDTYEWRNKDGILVQRFDAFDSPGRDDPKKYPFLPTQAFIDEEAKKKGEDHPDFMAFVRAFPPSEMGRHTVITPDMVNAWGMRSRVEEWEHRPDVFAALDPAFTSDGDDCAMLRAFLGREKRTGRVSLCFDPEPYIIPISSSSKVPVLQQIGLAARQKLFEWGVPVTQFACDDSGTQNVADFMEILLGPGLYRVNYSNKPPALSMGGSAEDTVDKRYRNTVTWLHYLMHEYARYGQIKGLPPRAIEELCSRRLDRKLKGLLLIESKKQFKKHNKNGRSPDVGDCSVMICGMVRDRFGFVPGTSAWTGIGLPDSEPSDDADNPLAALARKFNNIHLLGPSRYRG